MFLVSWKS